MGYQVARKHAARLRRLSLISGLVIPALLLLLAGTLGGALQILLLVLAVLFGIMGIVNERWLFFAEARHVVTLFYGRSV